MPYVGRDLQRGNYLKLDDISSSFDGSTTTFNLTSGGNAFFPGSAFSIIVSLGGVIQEPESAFQIDKSQIIFAAAPSPNDDFFCIVQGVALGVGVPGHNTVNNDQLAKPLSYGDYFRWDSANNRVGINTLLPSTALDVVGDATFSGAVSIGGTLTYEDVANIDAVGIITARAGIEDKTLTAGRVVYTGSGGRLVDNSNLTYSGTSIGVPQIVVGSAVTANSTGINVTGVITATTFSGIDTDKISEGNTEAEVVDTGSNGHFKVTTEGDERLRITSNGKVNIGTGNLNQTDRMLNVYGGRMRIEGISSGNSFEIMNSASAGQSNGILCQAGTNSTDINATFRNTSGTTLFRIRGDGKIGINEISPYSILHVNSGTTNDVATFESTDAYAHIYIRDNSTHATGTYFGVHGDDFRFATHDGSNSTERLRIDSRGDVYLSESTSLSSPYSSFNYLSIGNNLILNGRTDGTGGFAGMQHNAYLNSSGNWVRVYNDHATSFGSDNGNFYFRAAAGGTGNISWSNRLTIDSSGNVLVGTTDTTVYSNSSGGGIVLRGGDVIDIARSNDLQLTLNRTGNDGPHIAFYKNGVSKSYISTRNNALCFDVNGTDERIRIQSDGKLIISTNANTITAFDYAGIHFNSDNSTVAEGLFINNIAANTGDNASISFSTDSGNRHKSAISHVDTGNYGRGDLVFSIDPDADSGELDIVAHEKLRIRSSGQLVVNHTQSSTPLNNTFLSIYDANSDSSAIDASGISKNYAMISLHNYGTGNNGNATGIGFGAGSGFNYTKGSIAFQRQGSYGTGDLVFLTNNDQNTTMVNDTDEKMRITRSGYIGVGTLGHSSPTAPLSVNLESAAHNGNYFLDVKGSATKQFGLYYDQGSWGSAEFGIHEFDNSGNASQRFTIANGGNVGINETNPSSQLVVKATTDDNPSIRMYRQSTGGDIAALIWTTGSGNQAMINYRGGGGSVGMQFYTNGTSSSDQKLRISTNGQILQFADAGDNQFVSQRTGNASSDGNYYFHLFAKNNSSTSVGALGIVRDTGNDNARITFHTANGGTIKERARIHRWGGLQLRNSQPPYGSSDPASRYVYAFHRSGTYNTFWVEIRFATAGSYCLDLRMGGYNTRHMHYTYQGYVYAGNDFASAAAIDSGNGPQRYYSNQGAYNTYGTIIRFGFSSMSATHPVVHMDLSYGAAGGDSLAEVTNMLWS